MWSTAKELFKSKKALVAFVACIVWAAGRFGMHLDKEALLGVVSPLWAYVLAQGVADHGKEAAKVSAAADPNSIKG